MQAPLTQMDRPIANEINRTHDVVTPSYGNCKEQQLCSIHVSLYVHIHTFTRRMATVREQTILSPYRPCITIIFHAKNTWVHACLESYCAAPVSYRFRVHSLLLCESGGNFMHYSLMS